MIQFSIIIPLYNKANYIKKTIESVLAQTYKEYEIVIVNDGSTDNSLAVVGEITDPRICIFNKENGGVSAARNFGIEKARYEYIVFLDADDLWLPDYLETIGVMIEQYPQARVFATTISIIERLGKKQDKTVDKSAVGEVLLINNYCRSMMKGDMMQLFTGTICIKKELFNITGGFRVGVQLGEDTDMWLRLSLISPIVWKNESKAVYIKYAENNISKEHNPGTLIKKSFPYWEWYSYSSCPYLKMYTNQKIKAVMSGVDYKNKIYLLFKINWWYVLYHLFYVLFKKDKKK